MFTKARGCNTISYTNSEQGDVHSTVKGVGGSLPY